MTYSLKLHLRRNVVNTLDIACLSTHHYIEGVSVHELSIISINDENIYFAAKGSIEVKQLYGSDSDRKKDIGGIINNTFPFYFNFKIEAFAPNKFQLIENSIDYSVDTEQWYE